MIVQFPLTQKEYQTFDFLRRYQAQFGYAPTLVEIAGALNISDTTVGKRLKQLQLKGWVHRPRYTSRGIQIISPDKHYDITIIKVFCDKRTVLVTYNGVSRTYILKSDVSLLIRFYLERQFKYCHLSETVVLLTKKTARQPIGDLREGKTA